MRPPIPADYTRSVQISVHLHVPFVAAVASSMSTLLILYNCTSAGNLNEAPGRNPSLRGPRWAGLKHSTFLLIGSAVADDVIEIRVLVRPCGSSKRKKKQARNIQRGRNCCPSGRLVLPSHAAAEDAAEEKHKRGTADAIVHGCSCRRGRCGTPLRDP